MNQKNVDLFDEDYSSRYDAYNKGFQISQESLYWSMDLALGKKHDNARILCVGAGTGNELLYLAKRHSGWTFTALDPSPSMLKQCDQKIRDHNLTSRCRLVEGFVDSLPERECYDVILSLMVTHFITDMQERQKFFSDCFDRLRTGGRMVISEISADYESSVFPEMLDLWVSMHEKASSKKLDKKAVEESFRQNLGLIPAQQTEDIMRKTGFQKPVLFWNIFFMHAWILEKV